MPTAVLILPIVPDREEEWRRFTQDLLGDRLGEYEGFARRMGIRGVRVYLERISRRERTTRGVISAPIRGFPK